MYIGFHRTCTSCTAQKGFQGGEIGFGDAMFAEQARHIAGATFTDMVRTHEDQAYLLTVVPTVVSLSHKTSGSLGGHEVVLTGTGFHEEQGEGCVANQVLLAGVGCEVTECTRTMLRCTVAPENTSLVYPVAGTTGLAEKTWADNRGGSLDGWEDQDDYGNPLEWTKTSIGGADGRGAFVKDFGNNFADEHVGYFVPPLTSRYRFWASGDDLVAVWINKDGASFDGLEKVVEASYAVNGVVAAKSNPISLVAGKRYAIRTRHVEFGGNDWMLAGVEVMDPAETSEGAPHHPHTQYHRVKEIQRVELTATKRDQVQTITVSNVDVGGSFQVEGLDEKLTRRPKLSSKINIVANNPNAMAGELRNALRDAYQGISGCRDYHVTCTDNFDTAAELVFSVKILCPAPQKDGAVTLFPDIRVDGAELVASSKGRRLRASRSAATVTVETVVRPSALLEGTFQLTLGSEGTEPIAVGRGDRFGDSAAAELEASLARYLRQVKETRVVFSEGVRTDGNRDVQFYRYVDWKHRKHCKHCSSAHTWKFPREREERDCWWGSFSRP